MNTRTLMKGVITLFASLCFQTSFAACLTSESESNNTDTTANKGLCSGTAVTGSISSSTDYDWYRIDLVAGGTISINLAHASGIDLDWYLYPATGSYVTYKSTSSNPETGNYIAPAAGTYYIRVKSYSGSGAYTLTVTYPDGGTGGNTGGGDPTTPPTTSAVTGKVWLNGGAISQTNTAIFVSGLRQATGKNTTTPNINSTTNCSTDWNTTPCPRVAIITAAAVNQADGVDKFTNDTATGTWSYYNLFQRHGFSPKHILSHHDTYASNSGNTSTQGQANIAIINQADLVYVIGGDQSRLARTFLKDDGSDSPLMAAIRSRYNAGSLIYAGDSAGTAIAPSTSYGEGISIGYLNQNTLRSITPANCPYTAPASDGTPAPSCLTHPSNVDYGTKIKGFGFIPNANVDTHFDNRASRSGRLGRMIAALKNIGPTVSYGVDQNTALYVNGDVATVYGAGGVFVAEATSSNFGTGTKFSATAVRLSYLTAGDSFKFSDRTITTSKTYLIGSTSAPYQFSTTANSSDIFAVDANGLGSTTATFRHMADQTPTSSTGTAPSDSYNPSSFTLTFKRDGQTQSYKNASGTYSGPYTIKKALIDIN
ncbi:pre-peptidase C-terminal domain-containing protein [Undibacterium sp. LX40W]|uniref:Pre-peptidase C-terminal domain-containing protein n=1 Tax=Undibacterium nitidum TaxID=2762298 RepID=A0A923HX63_9BURK|nr:MULTISPECIES: pre-peptidase C-terminal domain-containing protein [Undibacterium]MBC3883044.1 pre-peptidase C-terminal domain-containing protein [Undibacterium nitidum]MBC3893325.1 pre-peptidase C-terminal domain-containing protein [Undibacterium sp. LX40W]